MLIKKCGDTYSFSVLFVKFAIQNKVRFKLKHNKNIKEAILYFGTSSYSAVEAMDMLGEKGIEINAIRVKAFPFADEVINFINEHQTIYVIEQNRDAQLRSLFMMENDIAPSKLKKVLQFNGMPITAKHIMDCILDLKK